MKGAEEEREQQEAINHAKNVERELNGLKNDNFLAWLEIMRDRGCIKQGKHT